MMISNLLVLLAQTGFVLLLALLIGLSAKKWPAARSAIYRLSIVAAIALAIGSPWLHERARPIVPIDWAPSHSFASLPAPVKAASTPASRNPMSTPAPTSAVTTPFDPAPLLPKLWLLIAALLTLRLVVGQFGLLRIRRSCSLLENKRVTELMPDIARQRGIRRPECGRRVVG